MAVLAMLTSCAGSFPRGGPVAPGDYQRRMARWDAGIPRSYRVHVPPGPRPAAGLPLVVVLHGVFSGARGIAERSGFDVVADEGGFVVVYPNGFGFLGLLRHWNAGHCCGSARVFGVDDAGFLDEVLDEVSARLPIDTDRVYVVGESNGAMLAYLYAATRSERVAAVGAVIGSVGTYRGGAALPDRIPPPRAPVPLVVVHGGDDTTIPFDDAEADPAGRTHVPATGSVAFWVRHVGSAALPAVEPLHGGRVQHSHWAATAGGAATDLYVIDDWGHRWPGPTTTGALAGGDPLRDFDAARTLWAHFVRSSDTTQAP
jgi:polyhydroxybutyrate depolymerase